VATNKFFLTFPQVGCLGNHNSQKYPANELLHPVPCHSLWSIHCSRHPSTSTGQAKLACTLHTVHTVLQP